MKRFLFSLTSLLLTSCIVLSPSGNKYFKYEKDYLDDTNEKFYDTSISGIEFLKYKEKRAGITYFPSHGEGKLLIVPIYFTDTNLPNLDDKLTRIDNAFNNLSSYYYEISINRLKISHSIIDPIRLPYELSFLKNLKIEDSSSLCVEAVLKDLNERNFDFSEFDKNEDKVIDGMVLMNFEEIVSERSLNWAFAYHYLKNSIHQYSASSFMWASYDFLDRGKEIDPSFEESTFVHEFGHMIGLDDYYSYSDTTLPLLNTDLMDGGKKYFNPYSRFLLDWGRPYVYNGSKKEFKLREHEFLIIPKDKYTNSVLDEYLIMSKYQDAYMLYHVDSRIGLIDISSAKPTLDVNSIIDPTSINIDYIYNHDGNKHAYDFISSNSKGYTHIAHSKLIKLLNTKEKIIAINGGFNINDMFIANTSFNKYTFYDGTTLKYPFEIDENLNIIFK